MAEVIYDESKRCWVLHMAASTYCIGLSADEASLLHVYWGTRITSEEALEFVQHSVQFPVSFESPTGMSHEEYAPWGSCVFSSRA